MWIGVNGSKRSGNGVSVPRGKGLNGYRYRRLTGCKTASGHWPYGGERGRQKGQPRPCDRRSDSIRLAVSSKWGSSSVRIDAMLTRLACAEMLIAAVTAPPAP